MLPATDLDAIKATIRRKTPRPKSWYSLPGVTQAYRELLDEYVTWVQGVEAPASKSGDGIVIAAGGSLYFACAYMVVRRLRLLGCKLPIEMWHLGEDELDQQMQRLVEPLGVVCRDALTVRPDLGVRQQFPQAFELKPFAIVNSSFARVLFMDADCWPIEDPTSMFLAEGAFEQTGAIFWPDPPPIKTVNGGVWIPDYVWDAAGVDWRPDTPAFESGQMLIDTVRHYQPLLVTQWLNEHSDYWYQLVYGDKDTFNIAWKKMRRPLAHPRPAMGHDGGLIQYHLNGRPLFHHLTQGKEKLANGTYKGFAGTGGSAEFAEDLRRQWTGNVRRSELKTVDGVRRLGKHNLASLPVNAHETVVRVLGDKALFVPNSDRVIAHWLLAEGCWEPDTTAAISRYVRPGMVCVDVGANFGYFSLLLAELSQMEVIAVEASWWFASLLKRMIAANQANIRVVERAAWNTEAEWLRFQEYEENAGGSAVADQPLPGFKASSQRVLSTRLERFTPCSLMKIDIEGAEIKAWEGLRDRRDLVDCLVLEVDYRRYPDQAEAFYSELDQWRPLRRITQDGTIAATSVSELLQFPDLAMLWLER